MPCTVYVDMYVFFYYQVNLVIDGWQSHSFILDYPHSCIRSRHRSSQLQPQLCLGHTVENVQISQHGHWHLGQMMLFKGKLLKIFDEFTPILYIIIHCTELSSAIISKYLCYVLLQSVKDLITN